MWKFRNTVVELNLQFVFSWMIKLGPNFFVVPKCSRSISGSSQLWKGMLSVAVFNSAHYEQSFTVVNFSGQTGTRLLSVSGYNQDGDQNRSELHCHILALWYSTFTFKIFRVLLAVKKKLNTEFNWIDQSGWKWHFFLFYCLESHRSLKSQLQYGFVSSTNITIDH